MHNMLQMIACHPDSLTTDFTMLAVVKQNGGMNHDETANSM